MRTASILVLVLLAVPGCTVRNPGLLTDAGDDQGGFSADGGDDLPLPRDDRQPRRDGLRPADGPRVDKPRADKPRADRPRDGVVPRPDQPVIKPDTLPCGNGKCEFLLGEACGSCPQDCGTCAVSCKDLEAAYGQALKQAKTCSPNGSIQQCTVVVDSQIACGCPTFVNANQKTAISSLTSVQKAYAAQKCQTAPCLPIPCSVPSFGSCTASASGTGGSCIDK